MIIKTVASQAAAEDLRAAISSALGYPIAGAPVQGTSGIFAPPEFHHATHHGPIVQKKDGTWGVGGITSDVTAKQNASERVNGRDVTIDVRNPVEADDNWSVK